MADESSAKPVVLALREAGHDVLSIAEVGPGATEQQAVNRVLAATFAMGTVYSGLEETLSVLIFLLMAFRFENNLTAL